MKYWQKSWNPVNGCKECSEGCLNCYAKKQAEHKSKQKEEYAFDNIHVLKKVLFRKFTKEKELIMVGTQSDVFLPEVSDKIIDVILKRCSYNKQKNFLILTKYAQRMFEYFSNPEFKTRIGKKLNLNNIIFGVSVENNKNMFKIELLQKTPFIKKRFVAFEPLLEKIDTKDKLNNIDWVVLGAESGENARFCDFEWLFDIVAVCYNENIPVFLNNYCDSNGVVTDEVDNENLRVEPFKL
jgi:protein gp37